MSECVLFEKLKDNKVKCLACKHYCVIQEGKTGICGIRKNDNGKLYLLVYGKAIGLHSDPIEKKPLYHFLPGTKILSLGTIGCNFSCQYCQNWDISMAAKELKNNHQAIKELGEDYSPEQIVELAVAKKIPSIAFTYNEPTIFFEYAFDIAKLAKEKNIKTVFVSNGYSSIEALKKLKPYLDAINIDLKAFNEKFYLETCQARLEKVKETIKEAFELGFWIEITTLLIPGKNDDQKELKKMAEFIAEISKDIPWHVTAFHPDYKMLDVERTSQKSLENAFEIGKKAGLKFVYVGTGEKENTFCPKCNSLLIERNGFNVFENKLDHGKCFNCGEKISGVWE